MNVLKRDRKGDDTEKTCEDRVRGWSDVSTSQGMSRSASSHHELDRSKEQVLPQKEPTCQCLDIKLPASKTERKNRFLL